jgi:hypothetical protein
MSRLGSLHWATPEIERRKQLRYEHRFLIWL